MIVVPKKFVAGHANDELDGDTEILGASDGMAEGCIDGVLLSKNVGEIEGVLLGIIDGRTDGSDDGCVLGPELGFSDGTALAHVSQHMANTVSNEHRVAESSSAAQAQSCTAPPSSSIANVASPAASPLHAEQQLAQQFASTSSYAHLSAVKSTSDTAHRQSCSSPIAEIKNFSVVASPSHCGSQAPSEGLKDGTSVGVRLGR